MILLKQGAKARKGNPREGSGKYICSFPTGATALTEFNSVLIFGLSCSGLPLFFCMDKERGTLYTPIVCLVSPVFLETCGQTCANKSEALSFSLITPRKYQDFCLTLFCLPPLYYTHISYPVSPPVICSKSWNWNCAEEPSQWEHTVGSPGLNSSVLSRSTLRCSVSTGAASVCKGWIDKWSYKPVIGLSDSMLSVSLWTFSH